MCPKIHSSFIARALSESPGSDLSVELRPGRFFD
jgi:hypothetical protein